MINLDGDGRECDVELTWMNNVLTLDWLVSLFLSFVNRLLTFSKNVLILTFWFYKSLSTQSNRALKLFNLRYGNISDAVVTASSPLKRGSLPYIFLYFCIIAIFLHHSYISIKYLGYCKTRTKTSNHYRRNVNLKLKFVYIIFDIKGYNIAW